MGTDDLGNKMTPEQLLEKYPEAQIDKGGNVAIKYRQPGRVLITGSPSGKEYVAVTEANICLTWVEIQDVDYILAKRGGCCNKKQKAFRLANEDDVRRWTNKGGR
jgi:hypothetical protein